MNPLESLSGKAHWFPRLALAAIFLYHGVAKVTQTSAMAEWAPIPSFAIVLLGLIEITGVGLLLWGGVGKDWATRLAGLIFAFVMAGVIVYVLPTFGWNSTDMADNVFAATTGAVVVGVEFHVMILATALFFAIEGNRTVA